MQSIKSIIACLDNSNWKIALDLGFANEKCDMLNAFQSNDISSYNFNYQWPRMSEQNIDRYISNDVNFFENSKTSTSLCFIGGVFVKNTCKYLRESFAPANVTVIDAICGQKEPLSGAFVFKTSFTGAHICERKIQFSFLLHWIASRRRKIRKHACSPSWLVGFEFSSFSVPHFVSKI